MPGRCPLHGAVRPAGGHRAPGLRQARRRHPHGRAGPAGRALRARDGRRPARPPAVRRRGARARAARRCGRGAARGQHRRDRLRRGVRRPGAPAGRGRRRPPPGRRGAGRRRQRQPDRGAQHLGGRRRRRRGQLRRPAERPRGPPARGLTDHADRAVPRRVPRAAAGGRAPRAGPGLPGARPRLPVPGRPPHPEHPRLGARRPQRRPRLRPRGLPLGGRRTAGAGRHLDLAGVLAPGGPQPPRRLDGGGPLGVAAPVRAEPAPDGARAAGRGPRTVAVQRLRPHARHIVSLLD